MKIINKDIIKTYLWLTASIFIMAVGVYFFKFPNNFTFGGISGFAVLVAKTGVFTKGQFNFIANIVLLIIGFMFLGRGFVAKTAYATVLLSVLLSAMERIFDLSKPLTNEPILELFFAIGMPALASAILFNMGASSGGTDVIAMLLRKYTSVDIGKALFLSDLFAVILSCFMFDIKTGLFSFLGLTMKSFVVDNIIESINLCKYFNIVCEDPDKICYYIVHNLNRSATKCSAKGAFTNQDKYIVFTVLNRSEAVKLRQYIKQEEPTAFILISSTSEIIGKGFNTI